MMMSMSDKMQCAYETARRLCDKYGMSEEDKRTVLGIVVSLSYSWAHSNACGLGIEARMREMGKGEDFDALAKPIERMVTLIDEHFCKTFPEEWGWTGTEEEFQELADYFAFGVWEEDNEDEAEGAADDSLRHEAANGQAQEH